MRGDVTRRDFLRLTGGALGVAALAVGMELCWK